MIKLISYDEILPIWESKLWADRKDPIEPISWMKYLGGYEDNSKMQATFFAWVEDGQIFGVNSGHTCLDGSYRSRGLWVDERCRGKGIAQQLLKATIEKGRGSSFIWSFPRKSSWRAYEKAGFQLTSQFEENLNNTNAFCILKY